MAKLESSLKNMILSLAIISVIAAGVLAGFYQLTKEPILRSQTQKREEAIMNVLKDKDATIEEAVEIFLDGRPEPYIIYPATLNGELVGLAIQTYTLEGYAGLIRLMVGVDEEGRVYNYEILETAETPGLGSKLTDWYKTEKGNQSIIGKNPETSVFDVKQEGGDFDAITASTISSKAFLNSIKDAFEAYNKYNQENH